MPQTKERHAEYMREYRKRSNEIITTYKLKAAELYDHEWWTCTLFLSVNSMGKVVKVGRGED